MVVAASRAPLRSPACVGAPGRGCGAGGLGLGPGVIADEPSPPCASLACFSLCELASPSTALLVGAVGYGCFHRSKSSTVTC